MLPFQYLLLFHAGFFVPPVDGVYLLSVYAGRTDAEGGPMYMKNNDAMLCEAFITADSNAEIVTCTAIAQLSTFEVHFYLLQSDPLNSLEKKPGDLRRSRRGD